MPPRSLASYTNVASRRHGEVGSIWPVGSVWDAGGWDAEWQPNLSVYSPEERANEFRLWRFPAAYLYEGEGPDDTLARMIQDMLGVKRWTVVRQKDYGFYDPSDWYPGRMHSDLCFVYDVKVAKVPEMPPWFAKLELADPSRMTSRDFGSAQGDLARALKLVKS